MFKNELKFPCDPHRVSLTKRLTNHLMKIHKIKYKHI